MDARQTNMGVSLLRRLGSLAAVLFCVVSITFLLIRLSRAGRLMGKEKSPRRSKQLLAKYKLDGSLWTQYSGYMADLLHGDLRLSTKYRNRSVNEILAQTLPVTLCLGGIAFVLATVGGIWLGRLAAMHQHTWRDVGAMFLALAAISLPSYIIGPVLILVSGSNSTGCRSEAGDWEPTSFSPAVTSAAPAMAAIARLMRGSMVETLQQDLSAPRAPRGCADGWSFTAMRCGLQFFQWCPTLGPLAAHLLTGSIIVETIFHIPGAGGFFVNSILDRERVPPWRDGYPCIA